MNGRDVPVALSGGGMSSLGSGPAWCSVPLHVTFPLAIAVGSS
jgi:hypothetical protein